jgi:hypothetical protein
MIRDLDKRLRKLESRLPPEESEEERAARKLESFLMTTISYYLGDPKPNETLVHGYRRALGYEYDSEFVDGLKHKGPDYEHRFVDAKRRLFMKFGVDLSTADDTAEEGEFIEALRRMYAGLPESRKEGVPIPKSA